MPDAAAALEIAELGRAPQRVDCVAAWLHGEWYARRGEGLEAMRERLLAGAVQAVGPSTFVACLAGQSVGTFRLEETAHPLTGERLSCLSNVFVAPAWRGRGFGRQLCEAAVRQASALRVARLSLFTASHGAWYAAQGWRYAELLTLRTGGRDVPAMLMDRELVDQSPTLAPAS